MQTHPPHLRDERLAWIAVEPALRHGFWARLFGRGKRRAATLNAAPAQDSGSAGADPATAPAIGQTMTASSGQDSFPMSRKMQRYAVAVDRVVPRLSPGERGRLRETGQVPSWFLGAVKKEFKTIRF